MICFLISGRMQWKPHQDRNIFISVLMKHMNLVPVNNAKPNRKKSEEADYTSCLSTSQPLFLQPKGRKVMAWETPMGWKMGKSPAKGIEPVKGLVLTESYDYETPELTYVKEARSQGFEVFAYDPNPGVVPMMVPYISKKERAEK